MLESVKAFEPRSPKHSFSKSPYSGKIKSGTRKRERKSGSLKGESGDGEWWVRTSCTWRDWVKEKARRPTT